MLRYIVLLGALVSFFATFVYIKEVIKGNAKPNRVSWLVWSIAPIIATIAALSNGVTWAVIPVFMSGFGPFLVFCTSCFSKKAYWKITKFDYLCGIMSVVALVVWYITKEPNYAIIFAILSDALAAIPTVIKSIKSPEFESSSAFIGGLFSASTSFLAITVWNFASLAFPVYLVIVNIVLISLIERKKIKI